MSARGFSFGSIFGSGGASTARSPTIGILFGTHNWTSCKLILDELAKHGLASPDGKTSEGEVIVRIGDAVTERITLAQLYGEWIHAHSFRGRILNGGRSIGMHDDLTNYLVNRTRSSAPFVIKYVPYGSLTEVGSNCIIMNRI